MEPTTDVLQEFEQQTSLEPASKGARFLNLIIDNVAFYIVIVIFVFVTAFVAASQADNLEDFGPVDDSGVGGGIIQLGLLFAELAIFILFYALVEGFSKGRTLGKLITGTVAVKENGDPITWGDAFLRSLCRLIPFEAFSALFTTPWHDSITGTMVIKKK